MLKKQKTLILFLILVLFLFGCSVLEHSTHVEQVERIPYTSDKEFLLKVARRNIINHAAGLQKKFEIPEPLAQRNDPAYVELYLHGVLLGKGSYKGYTLVDNVANAALIASTEYPFIPLPSKEITNLEILIAIPQAQELLENKSPEALNTSIDIGLDGVILQTPYRETAIMYPHESITKGRKHYSVLLGRLCLSKNLSWSCWNWSESKLYRFKATTFIESPEGKAIDLYRGMPLTTGKITKDMLLASAIQGGEFLLKMQDELGKFHYVYDPLTASFGQGDSGVRQTGTVYSLGVLSAVTGNQQFREAYEQGIDYFLSLKKPAKEGYYIPYNTSGILGTTALLLLAIMHSQSPEYDNDARELGDYIISIQNEDGSFQIEDIRDINYYPGEALFALALLYNKTKDELYGSAVERALPYYRDIFLQNKSMAFVPWQTQAYSAMYKITGKRHYADFVFELNDWLITLQNTQKSKVAQDFIGGFNWPNREPGISTAVYLEGLADAYELAKALNDTARVVAYREAITLALPFVLQLQFNEDNSYYIGNETFARGGFKRSPVITELRIDHTQHGIIGLLKSSNALYGDVQ